MESIWMIHALFSWSRRVY